MKDKQRTEKVRITEDQYENIASIARLKKRSFEDVLDEALDLYNTIQERLNKDEVVVIDSKDGVDTTVISL